MMIKQKGIVLSVVFIFAIRFLFGQELKLNVRDAYRIGGSSFLVLDMELCNMSSKKVLIKTPQSYFFNKKEEVRFFSDYVFHSDTIKYLCPGRDVKIITSSSVNFWFSCCVVPIKIRKSKKVSFQIMLKDLDEEPCFISIPVDVISDNGERIFLDLVAAIPAGLIPAGARSHLLPCKKRQNQTHKCDLPHKQTSQPPDL